MNDNALRERWALLGRLTEVFNDAEFLLHWLVWAALGGDSVTASAVTQRLGATELILLVRRLAEAGRYADERDGVLRLMMEASVLVERRNGYVHALWTTAPGADGGLVDTHQRLKDAVRKPDAPLVPFNAGDLGDLCDRFEAFVIAVAEVCQRLQPPDDDISARVAGRHEGAH